jgi:lipoprotein-anchoring transpeptidase ErfK/SrfK
LRFVVQVGAMLCGMAAAVSVAAGSTAFTAQSFQIFGGIEHGSTAITPQTRGGWSLPEGLRSRSIVFASALKPGSILIRTGARRLYFILPGGRAIEYHVGVGRDGFTWSGTDSVSRKAEWPGWRPTADMIAREQRAGRQLPAYMPGGPDNPLGARAIYIGGTAYRIHGTNQPWSIGQAVSSGCIRMINEEVIDLYARVRVGAAVVVEE